MLRHRHCLVLSRLCCAVILSLAAGSLDAADIIVTTRVGQQTLGANDTITVKNRGSVTHGGNAISGDFTPGSEGGNTVVVESGGSVRSTAAGTAAIYVGGTRTDANLTGLAGGGPLAGGASNMIRVDKGANLYNVSNYGAIRVNSNNLILVSGGISTQASDCIVLSGSNNELVVSGDLSTLDGNSDGIWVSGNNNSIHFSGQITTAGTNSDGIDSDSGIKQLVVASGLIQTSGDQSDAFEIGAESRFVLSGDYSTSGNTAHVLSLHSKNSVSHLSGRFSASGAGSYAIKSGRVSWGASDENLLHILSGASVSGGIHNGDSDGNATSVLTFGYGKKNDGQADLSGQDDDFTITLDSITSASSGNWDGYFAGGTTTLGGGENEFRHLYVGGDSFQALTLFNGADTQTDIVNISGAKASLNIEKKLTASGNLVLGRGSTLGLRVTDSSHAQVAVDGDITIEAGANIDHLGAISTSRTGLALLSYGGTLTVDGVDRTPGDFDFDTAYTTSTVLLDRRLHHSQADDTIYMDILVDSFYSKSKTAATHGMTQMLDTINRSGATGEMESLIARLQSIETDAGLDRAYSALSPVQAAAVPAVLFSSVQSVGDVIAGHMGTVSAGVNSMGISSARRTPSPLLMTPNPSLVPEQRKWTPFFEFVATKGDQADKDGISGYEFKNTGIVMGTDYLVSRRFLAGMSLSCMDSSVDSNDNLAATNMDTFQASAFSRFFNRESHLDLHAGLGHSRVTTQRRIPFDGTRAEGRHDAGYFTLGLGGGVGCQIGPGTKLEPFCELDYVYLNEDNYRETGAGAANLMVDGNKNQSLRSGLGLKLSGLLEGKNNLVIQPNASYKWQHEFRDGAVSSSASFVGSGSFFTTLGLQPDADHHILGTGVTAVMENGLNFYLDYELDISASYESHNGRFGVELPF